MKVLEFIERVYNHHPLIGEEQITRILLNLGFKGYMPEEIYAMEMEEALFLMQVPYGKQYRRGNTVWGSHLANA